jgi:cobyrinic acid a,c-diamide synthase
MKISREEVAQKLIDYLHHRITLAELVDWAESAMMEADFDERDYETLRDIVSRLGLADVKAFGMTWEDCEDHLSQLGYQVEVVISEAPTAELTKG